LKGGGTSGKLISVVGDVWARRGMVVFFSLAVIFIVSVLVVFKQTEFVQTKNIRY
jgi:hypothetical protein